MAYESVLKEATARLEALKIEIAELEQYIALHNKLFSDARERVSRPAFQDDTPERAAGPRIVIRRRNNPAQMADLAAEAILEAGKPMLRGELVDWIEARGVQIHSDDKPRYIGTILWRNDDRFENIEGRGYWLKGRPIPDDFESLLGRDSGQ